MPTPILIDFIDIAGTVESILAENPADARTIIDDKLLTLADHDFRLGFSIKVSDGQAFSDNLDEQEED